MKSLGLPRFIHGHNSRGQKMPPRPKKPKLEGPGAPCACGCGQLTRLAPYTSTRIGWVKGRPTRFINGHNVNLPGSHRPPVATPRPLADRFWEKVERSDDGCWLWIGSCTKAGYGHIAREDGRLDYAHRISWEIHRGPIPPDLLICHSCDVNYPPGDLTYRRCIRPEHLFLGSDADNVADMWQKGRGSPPPRRKRAS